MIRTLAIVLLALGLAATTTARRRRRPSQDRDGTAVTVGAPINLNTATAAQLDSLARDRQGHGGPHHRIPPEERRIQEAGRPDERARHRRKELPEAEADDHGQRGTGGAGQPGLRAQSAAGGVPVRSRARPRGYTLIELLFVMALVLVLSAIAIPQALVTIDAIADDRRGTIPVVPPDADPEPRGAADSRGGHPVRNRQPGRVRFATYKDGNHNGVRTRDIDLGIDRQIEQAVRLFEQFPGVDFGLILDGASQDPIQIGNTSLLTFTPVGTATSGSLYVRGRDGSQYAVRVLGATGRTRLQRYDDTATQMDRRVLANSPGERRHAARRIAGGAGTAAARAIADRPRTRRRRCLATRAC